jgi:hypothetical protein
MKYICRGDDHEDLTEKVIAAVLDVGVNASAALLFVSKTNKKPVKWRVHVRCSKGDENVFEGTNSFETSDLDAVCKVNID